jgi:hypothetical protein
MLNITTKNAATAVLASIYANTTAVVDGIRGVATPLSHCLDERLAGDHACHFPARPQERFCVRPGMWSTPSWPLCLMKQKPGVCRSVGGWRRVSVGWV